MRMNVRHVVWVTTTCQDEMGRDVVLGDYKVMNAEPSAYARAQILESTRARSLITLKGRE